ncbi:LicD family protein [Lachnospiraceae bacterium 48-21]
MQEIDMEQMKSIELEILKYIDLVCRENGIKYSLAGGTLLGAIRHNGFIPWDDDIDIILIRPEYDRLINILKKQNTYKLITPETEDYWQPFAKLMDPNTQLIMNDKYETNMPDPGVYVDIFSADGCPDTREEQLEFQNELREQLNNMRLSFFNCYNSSGLRWKRIIKKVVLFPKHIFLRLASSPDERKRRLLENIKRYDNMDYSYAGFLLSVYEYEVFPKEYFTDTVYKQFEDCQFQIMSRYDEYLKALYHDYMTLPPIEKRKSNHHYTAYYR